MTFWLVAGKDLRRELRSKSAILAGLVLAILFLLVAVFAFDELQSRPRAAAALLWTPLLFGGIGMLARSMVADASPGTLDWLRSAPVPRLWHGMSRTLLGVLLLLFLGALTVLATAGLFDLAASPALFATMALAAVGIAVIGSLAAGIAGQGEGRDVLLPVLIVPLLVPLVAAGIQATIGSLGGATLAELRPALLALVGYDILALAAAWFLWPIVLEGD